MPYFKELVFFFCLMGICALNISSTHATVTVNDLTHNPGLSGVINLECHLNEQAYQKNKLLSSQLETTIYLFRNAIYLYNKGHYSAALQKITQACSLSIQLQNQGLISRCFILKANCLNNLGFIKQSNNALAEGKTAIGKISDLDLKYDNLAAFYRSLALKLILSTKQSKWPDTILREYKKASVEQSKIKGAGFKSGQVVLNYYISEYYLSNNQLDSAQYYLYKSLNYSIKQGWNEYTPCIYYRLGYLRFKHKDYYAALDHYLYALSIVEKCDNSYQEKYIYLSISSVYSHLGYTEKANVFLKKYILCIEKLLIEDEKSIGYSLKSLSHKQERTYMDKRYLYMLWIISISSLILLVTIEAIWLYKHFKKDHENVQQTIKIPQSTMNLVNNQQLEKNVTKIELQEVLHMATSNDFCFFVKFKELEPEFINKLLQIAPNLVASELELCAYLRLRFKTNEIARFTYLSVRAVQGKKHRIRKKLSISTAEDLSIWMSKL